MGPLPPTCLGWGWGPGASIDPSVLQSQAQDDESQGSLKDSQPPCCSNHLCRIGAGRRLGGRHSTTQLPHYMTGSPPSPPDRHGQR